MSNGRPRRRPREEPVAQPKKRLDDEGDSEDFQDQRLVATQARYKVHSRGREEGGNGSLFTHPYIDDAIRR